MKSRIMLKVVTVSQNVSCPYSLHEKLATARLVRY